MYTNWSNFSRRWWDASETSCLVLKILFLSFTHPVSAIPSGWFWTWDLHLAPSPWAFLINNYWLPWGLPFSSAFHATLCRNFTLNTRSLSQWNLHSNWNNIMKHWNNPNIPFLKHHTQVLKTMEPSPVPNSKVLLLWSSYLPPKSSFILLQTNSLKRSRILLNQSTILMLRERHKISFRTKFIITRGQTEILAHIQCHTMCHCTVKGKNKEKNQHQNKTPQIIGLR